MLGVYTWLPSSHNIIQSEVLYIGDTMGSQEDKGKEDHSLLAVSNSNLVKVSLKDIFILYFLNSKTYVHSVNSD